MNTAQITRIVFAPCTGFGTEGRSASLMDADGYGIGCGYGATDDEAVAEALMSAGMTVGEAYDVLADVLAQAKQYRD